MQNSWNDKIKQLFEKVENQVMQKDKMILCIVIGLLIFVICIPVKKNIAETSMENTTEQQNVINTKSEEIYRKKMENELTTLLEEMEGVGESEVMITIKNSATKILAKEEPYEASDTLEEDGQGGKRTVNEKKVETTTVYGKDDSGEDEPFVVQEIQPEIEGVFIVAEGGDNKKIQMQITEAVQALFGIEAHKIKIVKKKS